MYTGKVVGNVVSSVKYETLTGIKLLIVETIENGKPGKLIVAADSTRQAGPDDLVYLIGSKEAAFMFRETFPPVDAAISGFVERYDETIK